LAKNLEPEIVFENNDFLVINKPAGLDSQNSKESRFSVVEWMRNRYGYAGLVHRLDLNTSGLMACAKNEKAAKKLTDSLIAGKMRRSYIAVVIGKLPNDQGQITHELDDKTSLTHYKVAERFANSTLVEVDLETGRKHQIRRHFALEGHPLLGDHLYKKAGSHLLFNRPALHAHSLVIDGQRYQALLPADIVKLVDRLRAVKSKTP